ncbi:hypothetical protein [Domibacillus enclensis]|uniref:Uncharacterized protein n=1 Tax=Domibacillus enclensis TaxID=1017273 RepID=A0A1N7AYA8_9BACI|nr:hypothetical protein [Domibacillus enclensis]SIR44069.1 hypothetical protein SAMN05443094_10880 [Domibacillus enclensis]
MLPLFLWAAVLISFFVIVWRVSIQLNTSNTKIEKGNDPENEKDSTFP